MTSPSGGSRSPGWYYPEPLHPDLAHRAEVIEHLGHVFTAAAKLGVPVVNTFIGNDKDKPYSENFAEFTKVPDISSLPTPASGSASRTA